MKQEKYDVVVVGSGMGGISSAGLLSAAGYKTLVVEKYPVLGGRFSTRIVEGFKTPTGAAGVEMGGVLEGIWKEAKAEFPVTPASNLYYWLEGKTFDMPSKGGLRELLSILDKVEADRAKIVGQIVKEVAVEKVMGAFKRGITKEDRLREGITFKDWLFQYTDNEKVLAVFQAIIAAMVGINAWEVPATYFFNFVSKAGGGGYRQYGFSTRGNIAVVEAMAKAIRDKGNDIWTNSPVKRIIVEKGQAKGVLVQKDGAEVEIQAQVVISNIGPTQTIELAGRDSFTAEYLKLAKERMKPVPAIALYIASDRPLTEVTGALCSIGTRRVCMSLPLSNLCPEVAPPGKHLLVTWGVPLSSMEQMDEKMELELSLQDLKEVFPAFEKHGRVLKVDMRNIDHEWPGNRTLGGWDLPQETPVPNLINVGDGVKPSGKVGLPSCAQTGRNAAELVKKLIKPRLG